jgi:glutamyl/glutaminyl-tRNA synthetase
LLRGITDTVDPTTFAGELPASSEEVFVHVAGELENCGMDRLGDARDFVASLRAWAEERGIKTRDLLHPVRLALTGQDQGPEMAHLFAVLGADEARRRIEQAREARLRA